MKFPIITTLFLLLSTSILFAQKASIRGTITTKNTSHAITDVYIYLEGSSYFSASNVKGTFEIHEVANGDYVLKTSAIGYKESIHHISITSGIDVEINLYLTEEINDLPLVEINAQNGTGGLLGAMNLAGSAHYISKKELSELNTTNVHDILQNIPGVQIQEEDGFGLRPNIGLRGSGSERSSKITIMEDGILAAPAPYAAPSAYYFPTVARMDAIEVIKGASQIKYGPFTTGGVINFISTTIPEKFAGNINIGLGSFGMRQIRANIGDRIGGFSYVAEGIQNQSTGFKTISSLEKDTGFDKKDWLAKVKWESSSEAKFYQSVQFKYAETKEISNETYLGISRIDFESDPYQRYAASQMDEMKTAHRQMNLHYLINPLDNIYVQVTAYRNSFFRNWYKLDKIENVDGLKTGIASLLNNPSDYKSEFSLLNGRSSEANEALHVKANNRNYISRGIQSKVNYVSDKHILELGFRAHYDEMDRFQWIDKYEMNSNIMELAAAGIPGTESNRIESALAYSTYFKYELSISKLVFDIGIRNENFEINRLDYGISDPQRLGNEISTRKNEVNILIPGVAIKYNIDESHQLFTGLHRGFSPPGSTPETAPELSINYELGYRIQRNTLFGSAVLFRNNFSNLLGADLTSSGGTGSGEMFNGGASVSQGLELALSYRKQITKAFYLPVMIQYTLTDARFSSTFESEFEPWGMVSQNDELPYLSKNTFNLRTGINSKKISMNISSNFMGAMRTIAGSGEFLIENTINSRWLFNIDCSLAITHRSSLNFAVHNITNKAYIVANRPAGWRPGAPRNFSLSLNNKF